MGCLWLRRHRSTLVLTGTSIPEGPICRLQVAGCRLKIEKRKKNKIKPINTSYKQVAVPTNIYHVPVVAFVAESTWSECLVSSSFFLWRRIEQENASVLFSYIMQPKGNLSLSLLLFCEFYGFLFCRPSCFLGPVFTQHLPHNFVPLELE